MTNRADYTVSKQSTDGSCYFIYSGSYQSMFSILILWTECRTGDVCSMAWDDVDFEKGTIHLRKTKTEIKCYVQLPHQATIYLKSMRMNSDKYLFHFK